MHDADGDEGSPSRAIDARIAELADWRGELLARLRRLVHAADPDVVETWKWRGVPVWEHAGILCTGETYRAVVKMTFAKGASLPDPRGLFNASLDGNVRRAIDFREGDAVDEAALRALVRAGVDLNLGAERAKPAKPARPGRTAKAAPARQVTAEADVAAAPVAKRG